MTEGAASLMTMFYGLYATGQHELQRGTNLLDSGSAIYETYECADGRFISIAPIEQKFRELLFERLGLPYTADDGTKLRAKLETLFKTRTRDEWCALLEGTDACFAPVLSMAEAPHHPHNLARGSFVEVDGITQPGPAPRFSRTPSTLPSPPQEIGEGTRSALNEWGIAKERIEELLAAGVLGEPHAENAPTGQA
jgi:alpha-methylacyl-CoA racemase